VTAAVGLDGATAVGSRVYSSALYTFISSFSLFRSHAARNPPCPGSSLSFPLRENFPFGGFLLFGFPLSYPAGVAAGDFQLGGDFPRGSSFLLCDTASGGGGFLFFDATRGCGFTFDGDSLGFPLRFQLGGIPLDGTLSGVSSAENKPDFLDQTSQIGTSTLALASDSSPQTASLVAITLMDISLSFTLQ